MKKLFALVATVMLSVSAYAAQFKEGEHYQVLKTPVSSSPVVSEFFSFYCPHCNTFEPIIAQLKQQLPEGLNSRKTTYPSWVATWVKR